MNYDEFRQIIEMLLPQCLPEAPVGPGRLRLSLNHAADGTTIEGFALVPMYIAAPGLPFSPTYHYSDLYRRFASECADESQIGPWLSRIVYSAYNKGARMAVRYYEVCTIPDPGSVFFTLINTDANRDYLKDIPHREFLDLSVVYRYFVGIEENKVGSSVVTHDMAEWLGMAEPRLYEAALANTPRIFPFRMEWASEMPGIEQDSEYPVDMLYVSTWIGMLGPNALLYPDVMDKVSAKLGGDAFIIPSSVHELLAVKADNWITGKRVSALVTKVNADAKCISPDERLSNGAYFFDSKEKTIKPATEHPVLPLSNAVVHQEAKDRSIRPTAEVEYGNIKNPELKTMEADMKSTETSNPLQRQHIRSRLHHR